VKILIAEDNPFFRRALEATLRDWGYEVVGTGDGNAAWEALHGPDAPRLAILDWMMPGLDGLELCRRIRAEAATAGTYVILLTAKGGKENILAGLDGGADDFIRKPYERDELYARLQVGLRRRRPRRPMPTDDGTTTLDIVPIVARP
jgi:DNA-binding response OmpR family regulator